ncbi:hypothetical protein FDECE_17743 [Fusarium decemcellulare]|nr:hypothetical protein FDECE_17743 [Fusarium decemcellulare]
MFHLALSLDGWSLFFKSSEEATQELKEVHDGLQRVIDIIKPLEGLKQDLENWEEHRQMFKEAIKFCTTSHGGPLGEVEDIRDRVRRLDETQQRQERKLQEREQAQEKKILLDFFSQDDLHRKHMDVTKMRHPQTGSWILTEPRLQQWLNSYHHRPSSTHREELTLWCHGIPGCGKTVLFSSIVDSLQSQCDVTVAAVYLSHKDPSRHDPVAIFRALVRQIAESLYGDQHFRVQQSMRELRARCMTPSERDPSLHEILELLEELGRLDQNILLCLDSIDKLPTTYQQSLLRQLAILTKSNIKVLLISRSSLVLRAKGN